jgi:hypothetical protein
MLEKIARTTVLAAALAAGPALAGSGAGQFTVNITLSTTANGGSGTAPPASGLCISQSESEQTGAIVRVVCQSGQFVSISPRPGARFIDTHGGAYAYYFGPISSSPIVTGGGESAGGMGTVASLRVYAGEGAGVLDMLVTF